MSQGPCRSNVTLCFYVREAREGKEKERTVVRKKKGKEKKKEKTMHAKDRRRPGFPSHQSLVMGKPLCFDTANNLGMVLVHESKQSDRPFAML